MPPGTKLKITYNVMARNGFLLLTPAVVKVLGGHVEHMVEKWKASKVGVCSCRIHVTILLEKVVTERSKVTGNVGDGPPAFVPFSEATNKKLQSAKPMEQQTRNTNYTSATQSPQKHSNQPKQNVMPAKQVDKPKPHQHHIDKTCEIPSLRVTANKPHQHHQAKSLHQHDRFHGRPFQGQPSKHRPYNPQLKRSKGPPNDSSQGHALSEFLPVTFSSEEHFPTLSHPTRSHPQPSISATDDRHHHPTHKPMLAWDNQTSNTTTGGSIPFSAKRKT